MAAPKNHGRTRLGSPRVGIPKSKGSGVLGKPAPALPKTNTITAAKHQNEELKGRLLAIDVAVKEGRLVDRMVQDRRDFVLLRTVRDAIRSIPRRIAAEVHAADDVPSVQRILSRELDDALRVLCDRLDALETAHVQ
jgi:hypothetical protein